MMARISGNHTAAAMNMVKTTLTMRKPLNMKTTPASSAATGRNRNTRARMYILTPASAICSAVNQP